MVAQPTKLRIRMYNVGFGDCFLLSFEYASGTAKHMLIDFGTNAAADGGLSLLDIADLIKTHCGRKLDVLVLSHRHRDHIKGFNPKYGGDVIAGLKPKLVIRSWTENPKLGEDDDKPLGFNIAANGDSEPSKSAAEAERAIGEKEIGAKSIAYARSLKWREDQLHSIATHLNATGVTEAGDSTVADFMALAYGPLKNKDAVAELEAMSGTKKGRYVYSGKASGVTDTILPGVTVRVLGPPTPDQYEPIRHKAAGKRDDYLFNLTRNLGLRGMATAMVNADKPDKPRNVKPTGPERWIVDKLSAEPAGAALELVRSLDAEMNNTSVVLMITARDQHFLFGGDAQGESWDWMLTEKKNPYLARNTAEIQKALLYKVGHHGSRNATPLGLLKLWPKRAKPAITALLSTKPGVYKGAGEGEVPRGNLIDALKERTVLISTNDPPGDEKFIEVACDLTKANPKVTRV